MLRELVVGAFAVRRALGPHHRAGLGHLVEPAQIVVELLVRILAEVARHRLPQPARRGEESQVPQLRQTTDEQ